MKLNPTRRYKVLYPKPIKVNKLPANTNRTLSLQQARCVVLEAKGFAKSGELTEQKKQEKSSWRQIKSTLLNMRALQLDAINTVIRTHYMPLYSRLGNYNRDDLDSHLFDTKLQSSSKREFFEYWGHECSVMPLADYPLLFWRMQDARDHNGLYKQCTDLVKQRPGFIKQIKSTIANNGPMRSRDLESSKRGPGMWEWSDTKQALEYLFWTGEITTRGRNRFERLYDLTENSIPANILDQCRTGQQQRNDAQDQLILNSVRALGLGTEADIRDYFRLSAKDASACIQRLLEDKKLEALTIESWEKPAYWIPGTAVPRSQYAPTLLSPFDPLVWNRKRIERLFNFNYRIEIYIPEHKRQYGYYVLPFLIGNRLSARVDMKSDRNSGHLRVLGIWWEPHVSIQELDTATQTLDTKLQQFAIWLGLDAVDYTAANNSLKQSKVRRRKTLHTS